MLTSEVRPAEARFELTLAFHCAPALQASSLRISLPSRGKEMRPTPCWRPTPPPWPGRGSLCGPCAGAAAAVWYWCTGGTAWSASWSRRRWPVCWNRTAIPWPAGWRPCWTIWRPGWRGAVGSPMRWGCSWDIPPRMWRAFAGMAARAINTAGCGRSIPTWRGPRDASGSTAAAEGPCAAAWRPAAGWSSCFGQLDGDRG